MRQSHEESLRDSVLREFESNPHLDASTLDASVDAGVDGSVVTLVGTVASLAEKLTIQSAVESLDQVHDVVSHIDVKRLEESDPTDQELRDVLAHVLIWDALVPENAVGLDVLDGWVTLAGIVASESQRDEAEHAISRILGVRGIDNRIEVAEASMTIRDVRRAIDSTLQRRAAHRSRKIDVIVDDGVVVLRGEVESLDQRNALHAAVAHAPGVDAVSNELVIC